MEMAAARAGRIQRRACSGKAVDGGGSATGALPDGGGSCSVGKSPMQRRLFESGERREREVKKMTQEKSLSKDGCHFLWRENAGGKRSCYAERFPSLLDPLPGLHLPPGLHDKQSPPPPPHTEVTTIPNGVRIASQDIPRPSPISCVGVAVGSGSVYETRWLAGVSHLLERLAFHDTKNRNLGKIALDVEATGGALGASAGRERMFYSYSMLRAYLPQAVEVLLDCVRNPAFLHSQVQPG